MFSYPAGLWQTRAAKRAENRLNGIPAASSGDATDHVEMTARDDRLDCRAKAHPSTAPDPIMAIIFLRWTLTQPSFIVESLRKPALQPVSREADVCMPALLSVIAILLTSLFRHSV